MQQEVRRFLAYNRGESSWEAFPGRVGAKAYAKGRAQGLAEGQACALHRLLKKRFGAVSSGLHELLNTADENSIETWLDRVFDAHDLNSVFRIE